MIDLVATMTDVVSNQLTGPSGIAAALLLLSVVVSAIIVFLRSDKPKTLPDLLRSVTPPLILTNASARADFSYWISRKFVMLLVALPTGISITLTCSHASHAALAAVFGDGGHMSENHTVPLTFSFAITTLLAYDISYYLYRNLQHRVPVLWELHEAHHSAEVMVGSNKDRIHPIDDLMKRVWDGLITGPIYGVWLFFAFDPVEITILGINVYVLRNVMMMGFVRHTHLKVSFGTLVNNVTLFSHYHQLYHIVILKHFDKKFGLMLEIWNRVFGTLRILEPDESFAFGLGSESKDYQSIFGLHVLPLRKIARLLGSERVEVPPHASTPVQFGTAQLGITSRQKDHVA